MRSHRNTLLGLFTLAALVLAFLIARPDRDTPVVAALDTLERKTEEFRESSDEAFPDTRSRDMVSVERQAVGVPTTGTLRGRVVFNRKAVRGLTCALRYLGDEVADLESLESFAARMRTGRKSKQSFVIRDGRPRLMPDPRLVGSMESGAEGQFAFDGLEPGLYVLVLDSGSSLANETEVRAHVRAGVDHDLGAIELPSDFRERTCPGRSVTLRVRKKGFPAESILVRARSGPSSEWWPMGSTTQKGECTFAWEWGDTLSIDLRWADEARAGGTQVPIHLTKQLKQEYEFDVELPGRLEIGVPFGFRFSPERAWQILLTSPSLGGSGFHSETFFDLPLGYGVEGAEQADRGLAFTQLPAGSYEIQAIEMRPEGERARNWRATGTRFHGEAAVVGETRTCIVLAHR